MAQAIPKIDLINRYHKQWTGLGFLHPEKTTSNRFIIVNEYYSDLSSNVEVATGVEVVPIQVYLHGGWIGLIAVTACGSVFYNPQIALQLLLPRYPLLLRFSRSWRLRPAHQHGRNHACGILLCFGNSGKPQHTPGLQPSRQSYSAPTSPNSLTSSLNLSRTPGPKRLMEVSTRSMLRRLMSLLLE